MWTFRNHNTWFHHVIYEEIYIFNIYPLNWTYLVLYSILNQQIIKILLLASFFNLSFNLFFNKFIWTFRNHNTWFHHIIYEEIYIFNIYLVNWTYLVLYSTLNQEVVKILLLASFFNLFFNLFLNDLCFQIIWKSFVRIF